MHQTVREFLTRTIPRASNLNFNMSEEGANRVITTTLVRYLMLCFTSPAMQDRFSKIESWSPGNYRAYAEYLNGWPLIDYALRYIKENRDRYNQDKKVPELVTTLVKRLTDGQATCFLGGFMDFHFGQNNGEAISVNEHRATSEDIKYNTLNAAAELPELPHAKALLLTCTQDDGRAEHKTPLIISAQKGLTAATRLLLGQNIDKDAKDNSGRTALHYAAENCNEDIVRLLVEQGAKRDIFDNVRKVALELAIDNMCVSPHPPLPVSTMRNRHGAHVFHTIAGSEYLLRCSRTGYKPLTGVQLLDPVTSRFRTRDFPSPEHVVNLGHPLG